MDISYDDKLAVLGLVAGGYVLVTVIGTLLGQPWATAAEGIVGLVQVVGILLSILVAAILVLVTQDYDVGELLSLG
ncbi:hypothetical protein GRX03_14100 [Halovenus sp. WSH3]|uniref:DUF8123 domain-containing protein n=1 Tax=Halovenus carboxidivorans TaxID=2692199 RepID=A0A6B0TBI0_9EURY|nr:hypothetical protein [Halovenus carboxidivorans]MXR52732.1 hypothetical protein [Halovenus carboxidivorans]